MNDIIDENIGKRIGIYDILYKSDKRYNGGSELYHIRCVFCGWETDKRLQDIKKTTKCSHVEVNGNYKAFNSYKWDNNRIGAIFKGIKARCYNKKCKAYKWYGEKGIKVYNGWLNNPKSFEEWAVANGYSDNLTIDRIDDSKDYCPENCRWITMNSNAKYKSTTRLIDVDGEVHTGRDWSKIIGFGPNVINKYIRKYGLQNTVDFIRRYINSPKLKRNSPKQSSYDLYMNNNIDK